MIAGEPDPLCPDVHAMIDSVALQVGDERLDDLVRVTAARLGADELAAWHAWRQDWTLRVVHRVQLAAGLGAVLLSALAAASALAGGPAGSAASGVPAGLAWPAAVVLCGLALFLELSISTARPGIPTFPARVRLASRIRTRVNLQPLRNSAVEELIGGPRADVARLVVVARACASSITGGPGWRSGRLDALRVRCDVDRVLARIASDAVVLELERVGLGSARVATAGWTALVDRVRWLQRYDHQLRMLIADGPGGPVPADRRPALHDRIVSDLRFIAVVLTWTDRPPG